MAKSKKKNKNKPRPDVKEAAMAADMPETTAMTPYDPQPIFPITYRLETKENVEHVENVTQFLIQDGFFLIYGIAGGILDCINANHVLRFTPMFPKEEQAHDITSMNDAHDHQH